MVFCDCYGHAMVPGFVPMPWYLMFVVKWLCHDILCLWLYGPAMVSYVCGYMLLPWYHMFFWLYVHAILSYVCGYIDLPVSLVVILAFIHDDYSYFLTRFVCDHVAMASDCLL